MMNKVSVRTLQMLTKSSAIPALAASQQIRMINQIQQANMLMFNTTQMRAFGGKKKRSKGDKGAASQTEDEAEPVEEVQAAAEPEPVHIHEHVTPASTSDFSGASKAQVKEQLSQDLYQAFNLGDIKEVTNAPDDKPPTREDSIEGRYASVLFSSASRDNALFTIYEDIAYLQALYKNSETFRQFVHNAGVGMKEIAIFNEALKSLGDFHPITIKFLEVLAENKRLVYISGISERYQKLYKELNREEKITIISAETLDSGEQAEVLAALQANPDNQGKQFLLDFTIDPSIKGGLQMYTETEFMDMSLSTRLTTLRSEISKLVE